MLDSLIKNPDPMLLNQNGCRYIYTSYILTMLRNYHAIYVSYIYYSIEDTISYAHRGKTTKHTEHITVIYIIISITVSPIQELSNHTPLEISTSSWSTESCKFRKFWKSLVAITWSSIIKIAEAMVQLR